jgi:hypothetical protein
MELVTRDFDLWADQRDFTLDSSRPSKPTDHAFVASFNGQVLRNFCNLDLQSLDQASFTATVRTKL